METTFENKVDILGNFYMNYRDSKELEDFFEFNDLGLPLAFLATEGVAEITPEGIQYIDETWTLLLGLFEIEDMGFESLEELLASKSE